MHFNDPSQVSNYKKNSKLQWDWAIDALGSYPFTGQEVVLDVGSGDGKITALIAKSYTKGRVVGVDISPLMVREACRSFCEENLKFSVADAKNLPFHAEFDLIFSNCCLHYLAHPEKALMQMHKSLKNEGIILLLIPGGATESLASYSTRLAASKSWKKHFIGFRDVRSYLDEKSYLALLQSSEFSAIQVEMTLEPVHFLNRDELVDFYLPISQHARFLEEPFKGRFIQELIDFILSDFPPTDQGEITLFQPKLY